MFEMITGMVCLINALQKNDFSILRKYKLYQRATLVQLCVQLASNLRCLRVLRFQEKL